MQHNCGSGDHTMDPLPQRVINDTSELRQLFLVLVTVVPTLLLALVLVDFRLAYFSTTCHLTDSLALRFNRCGDYCSQPSSGIA